MTPTPSQPGRRARHRLAPVVVHAVAAITSGLAVAGGACAPVDDDDDDDDANSAPAAVLLAPQLARAGEPAVLDATLSSDVDGDALRFAFLTGDGTPAIADDDGLVEHLFAAPGRATVIVNVEDAAGLTASAAVDVVIVEGTVEGCSCQAACLAPGLCTEDGCAVAGLSANAEGIPRERLLRCD